MHELPDIVVRLLEPPALLTAVFVLRLAFFLLAAFALFLVVRYRARGVGRFPVGRTGVPAAPRRVLGVALWLLLLAVFVYQGSWQLAGFARPGFVAFMRRHNHRPVNPASLLARGRILDRTGTVLADNDPENGSLRRYPLRGAVCHLVGYVSPFYGITGLEAADEAYLSGHTWASREEADRFGRNILDPHHAVGNDLTLTLDAGLQQAAIALLGSRPGAVVALDPATGAILALASTPTFDPNNLDPALFSGAAPGAPLLNRATQGLYPPGSVFKIALAALAIEKGETGPLRCSGAGFQPVKGGHPIRDHEYFEYARRGETWPGHGSIDLAVALRRSSNVYFAQLGTRLGAGAFDEASRRFMLDQRLTLFQGSSDRLASKPCVVPHPGAGALQEIAELSIGQGRLLVTPLHMAVLTAAIAHEGLAMRPRLDAGDPPAPLGRLMDAATARRVGDLMRDVVARGTGTGADIQGLDVAGKTGTAQNPSGEDHSWFVCFAPRDRPRLALAVIVENGGFGSRAAVPIAATLLARASNTGLLNPEARAPARTEAPRG